MHPTSRLSSRPRYSEAVIWGNIPKGSSCLPHSRRLMDWPIIRASASSWLAIQVRYAMVEGDATVFALPPLRADRGGKVPSPFVGKGEDEGRGAMCSPPPEPLFRGRFFVPSPGGRGRQAPGPVSGAKKPTLVSPQPSPNRPLATKAEKGQEVRRKRHRLDQACGLTGGDEHRVPHRGVGRRIAQVQV